MTKWIILLSGFVGTLPSIAYVTLTVIAMSSPEAEASFLMWTSVVLSSVVAGVLAYVLVIHALRRASELKDVRRGKYAILPLLAQLVRYNCEAGFLYVVLNTTYTLVIPLLLANPPQSRPLASSSPFGYGQPAPFDPLSTLFTGIFSAPWALKFLAAFLILLFVIVLATMLLAVMYGIAAFVEGFEDLVTSNRSIDDSCQAAMTEAGQATP